MSFLIPFAGADLLGIENLANSFGLTVLSNTSNAPPPATFAFGNDLLGGMVEFESGPQSQPSTGAPAPLNLDILEDIGHGRIENLELDLLGNNLGAAFQEGDSSYQANPTLGALLDGDLGNGFDGNNIENVHLDTIVQGLNIVATYDNSGANADPIPVDIFSPLVHGDTLAGLGGGHLDDVAVGGQSLFGGPGLGDLFHG